MPDYQGPVLSREDAKAAGLKRYFLGERCVNGHLEQRATSTTRCLACVRDRQRTYMKTDTSRSRRAAWKAKNLDRVRAKNAEYRAANADDIKRKNAEYREANRERIRAYTREAYEADPEKFCRRSAAWREENPDQVRAIMRAVRARIKNAPGECSAEEFADILKRQRFRCAYCRVDLRKTGHHADHIVALSLGGTNHARNIQATCPTCNRRKGAKDYIEFAQQLGFLI